MQGRKYHEAAIKISIDELESWINVSVSKNGASIRSQQSVVQKRETKSPLSHLQCVSLNNSSAFLSRFLLAVMLAISLRYDVLQRNTNPTSFLYY